MTAEQGYMSARVHHSARKRTCICAEMPNWACGRKVGCGVDHGQACGKALAREVEVVAAAAAPVEMWRGR